MIEPSYSFMSEFSETDKIHFLTLVRIRPQTPSEGQLRLIEALSRSLSCKRLLTLIARTPHWLMHGPILEALSENEHTPETIRRDLEMAVSLFDLIVELDKAPLSEKTERSTCIKSLYQQLPAYLKPILKQQAHTLAKQINPSGKTQELPPLPSEEQDWDTLTNPPAETTSFKPLDSLPRSLRLNRALTSQLSDDIILLVNDDEPEIRQAALHNSIMDDALLFSCIVKCHNSNFIEDIYSEAKWYFREDIREALYNQPVCPVVISKKILVSRELTHLINNHCASKTTISAICALFSQIDETEFQFITYKIKLRFPFLLRIVKLFYDKLERRRSFQTTSVDYNYNNNKWNSIEERLYAANQTIAPEQLISALKDPDIKVFALALENPILSPRELVNIIPYIDSSRIEIILNHHTWKENLIIQESILHSNKLSESTTTQLLDRISNPHVLINILRDSRLINTYTYQYTQQLLKSYYISLNVSQRVILLKASGGEIIKHLPSEILKDENTLLQLISDRQVDPSILLRLARNKLTPRSILESIASHPVLMAHPAIMSELLLNPKSPRESAVRIWGLLSESEQEQLLKSPHLPVTLRQLK